MRIEPKHWIVVRTDGERYLVDRMPHEGILPWAQGQFVTVLEYNFGSVVYEKHPPIKEEASLAPRPAGAALREPLS